MLAAAPNTPSSTVFTVRELNVNEYLDKLQSKFKAYTIPSITKSDASELQIKKIPFFQWINTINKVTCDTVRGIENIADGVAASNHFGLVNAFRDANQYHQAASRMTSILHHYYPQLFYTYIDNGDNAETELLIDFNNYVPPVIGARTTAHQEGIICDITQSCSLAIVWIIESLILNEDINTAISTFGVDPYKLRHSSTAVHSYLYARFLHCVVLAAIVPDGIAFLELTMAKLEQIPKAITGSLEEIETTKATVLAIRNQIRLAATSQEYPERRFIIAFINVFDRVPEDSLITRVIRDTITSETSHWVDASATMTKISNSVRHAQMIYGTTLLRHGGNTINPINNGNNVIQLQQQHTNNVVCTFCADLNTRLKTKFSTTHHFDACFRRRRPCSNCGLVPENSAGYHFKRDCPNPTTVPTKYPHRKNHRDDNREGKDKRKRVYKAKAAESNDDDGDDSTSSGDEAPQRHVKLIKYNRCSTPLILLDSGANTNTIPSQTPANHNIPTSPTDIHIHGIGNMGINIKKKCEIYDMTHYVVDDMDTGVVSIHQLCTKYKLRILFLSDRVEIMTEQGTLVHTGFVNNGLYVLQFQDYILLLATVNHQHALVATNRIYMAQHPLLAHMTKRIIMTKVHQEYIQLIHACMGHPTSEKMISSIIGGMELPEPPKNELILRNIDTLCRLIERYFTKYPCIPCDIVHYKRLSNKTPITLYPDPTKPFYEISIDYKPADIISYNGMVGTYVCCCIATMYGAHYPVKSERDCIHAVEYFITIANKNNWKVSSIRADAAHTNFSEDVLRYIHTRGIKATQISVGRQERNFVEKYIDILFKTYYKIHTSQCLLDASYWPLGIDTAITYQNNLTNSRCTDMSPYRAVTGQKPRIQVYTYGMPVLVNRQKKHFSKTVEYMVDNKLGIVAGIDNDVSHGVRVILCQSGRIDYYYDLIHPVPFDQYNPQSRQEIQMRFRLPHPDQKSKKTTKRGQLDTFNFATLPPIDRVIRTKIPTTTDNVTTDVIMPNDETTIRDQPPPIPEQLSVAQTMYATIPHIVPYVLIKSDKNLVPLDEQSYTALSPDEKKPTIKKIWDTPSKQRWCNSIIKELSKWDNNAVGEIVRRDTLPSSANILPTKFVLTYKHKLTDDGVWIYDANTRLTGRGDLEHGTDDESEYYAPTTYLTTVFTLLALAVQEGWHTTTFDVIGAFLKTPIDEDIYITMPSQILPYQYVIKLNKYLYGLKKANNRFNQHIHSLILKFATDIKVATTDICLYYNDDLRLALFVDDGLLITKTLAVRDVFLQYLDTNIGIETHLTPKQFLKLELEFSPTKDCIKIHQANYIKLLQIDEPTYTTLFGWNPKLKYCPTVPLPTEYSEMRRSYMQSEYCTYIKAKPVQKIVGSLIWIIYSTLPELQLVGHLLAKYQAVPTEFDFFMAYNVYLYIKNTPINPIIFTRSLTLTLSVIADGAHMRNFEPDGMVLGQLGYIIMIGNCTIMASSMAALRPTRSAFETEMQAGGVGLTQLQYINLLLSELKVCVTKRIYYTDCLSIIKLVNRQMQLSRQVRHFANEIAQLKLAVTGPLQLELLWIPTGKMPSDLLTKLKIKTALKEHFTNTIHNGALFHQDILPHAINMTSNTFPSISDIIIDEHHSEYRAELITQLQITYDDNDLDYMTEI